MKPPAVLLLGASLPQHRRALAWSSIVVLTLAAILAVPFALKPARVASTATPSAR